MPGRFWPLAAPRNPTSGWGQRWGTLHDGQDWGCPEGTPVYSCHDGTVYVRPWDDGGYGWWVEVIGPDFTTQYGHLSVSDVVPSGSWQPAGTLIGYSGNTGGSTGPHLHLRVKRTGAWSGFDPLPWLDGAQEPGSPPAPEPPADGDLAHTDAGVLYRWGRRNGLSVAGAAGLLGNLQQESNFWSDAVEGHGRVGHIPVEQVLRLIVPGRFEGVGMLQWSFDRRTRLLGYLAATGRPWWDLEGQCDFLLVEVNESERYRQMWARMCAATDPVAACRDMDDVFVRSGVKGQRFTYAQQHFARAEAGRYDVADVPPKDDGKGRRVREASARFLLRLLTEDQ